MALRLLCLLLRINGPVQMLKRILIEAEVYLRYLTPRKLLNAARLQWHYWRRDTVVKGSPYRFYVEPTNACQLRCPFCFGWQERSRRDWGMIKLDTFKSIVDEVAPYAFWIDLYNRGEPLLHPEICQMISYAHSHAIGTKISSNLNAVDESVARCLVESGLDYLVGSLDGASQETYSAYRVGGDFEAVVTGLRMIVRERARARSSTPFITVRTLVNVHNEHELEQIKHLATEIGVDNVIFTPMIVNMASDSATKWLPSSPAYSFYDYGRGTNVIARGLKACPELWRRGTVTWDGRVFPCCFADGAGEELGYLSSGSMLKIWNNKAYQASRAVFRRSVPQELDGVVTVCTGCRAARKRR